MVSVIIPVYNVEPYLDKCLHSVVMQSFQDIEVIVINDGSPDNSQQIIDKYLEKYPDKVFGYLRENSGVSAARNYGVRQSKGEYIAFIDGDDYIDIDYVQKLMETAECYDSEIVVCGLKQVDEQGNVLKTVYLSQPAKNFDLGDAGVFISCATLHKRVLIDKWELRFPEGKYYEDIPFSLSARMLAKNVKSISYAGYNYVQRQGSTSHRIMNNKIFPFDEIEQAIVKIKENTNKQERLEFEILLLFSGLLFLMYRKASTEDVEEICDFTKEVLKKYFPKYWKNKNIGILKNRHMPFVKRIAVRVLVLVNRLGVLTPFTKIITR